MNYHLTEEQQRIQQAFRKVAQEVAAPLALELDEKEEFPWKVIEAMRKENLMGLFLPREYDGLGGSVMELCLAVEELSRVSSGIAISFAANALGSFPILLHGNEEQKKKYLTPVARGEKMAAFGLTEPEAGSDATGIQTTATKKGDFYLLRGNKQWITNGKEAETYTIFASTDRSRGGRGISAFIVEKGWEGFTFGRKEEKLGIRCSTTMNLIFDDCPVPKENLLGREGLGFVVAMKTLDKARPGVAAQGLGIAQGGLDVLLDYLAGLQKERGALPDIPELHNELGTIATLVEATRALIYAVARSVDSGDRHASRDAAMAKLFASDVSVEVANRVVSLMGLLSIRYGHPAERLFRDAKITQIYEGTNEIQKGVIALEMIKGLRKRE
ncbi:MAG: acyl-CoA dehydrogenase family protein [Candidatus Eremiobacteraeota bacterium]|nr:acyl-CoA dehydrogenase family protein [Candidatus Eremiobacteraeota bacterium]